MRLNTNIAVVASVAALAVVAAGAAGAGSRVTAAQPSAKVVVVPGFNAPVYPGFKGVPSFPAGASQLAGFTFSQLTPGAVTTSSLAPYDTIILYGLRWGTLSAAAQSAINTFAQTGKVLIWDADATGSQDYGTFVHPFTSTASGEVPGTQNGSVVSFPPTANGLASASPSNPAYLDPSVLVSSNHLVQDMSVMNPGAVGWTPALVAANETLPSGGWILAWAYGSSTDKTGLVVYTGMDADAFDDPGSPNYALKELQLQLLAPFYRSPTAGGGGGTSGGGGGAGGGGGTGGGGSGGSGGGSGLGDPSAPTFAHCTLARLPKAWVRGSIRVRVDLAVAVGTRGEIRDRKGTLIAAAKGAADGKIVMRMNTKRLPSNRLSTLRVLVYVNAAKACTLPARVRADNSPPRLLAKSLRRAGKHWRLTVRPNETVKLSVWARNKPLRVLKARGGKNVVMLLAVKPVPTAVVLVDRAGNTVFKSLARKKR